ncbi:hypothetical protein HMPREF1013_00851 [Bacillus sp. 2_A_57_CT2]|nr:hypothetical protein HMPREF1013_00851 [Bacillus sp. 2_A_57_CT2]
MPEIQIINFNEIWEVAGPFIITIGVILIMLTIAFIILGSMSKGVTKELTRVSLIVSIILVTIISFQVTSFIWGH